MKARITIHDNATFTLRHRAVCDDDNYRSPWFANVEDAYRAANAHRQQPGNETHIMHIITEQTLKTRFE